MRECGEREIREISGRIQGGFREDSGRNQGDIREKTGRIQGDIREDSGRIQFREGQRNVYASDNAFNAQTFLPP